MCITGMFRPSRASCALLVAFFSVTIPGLLTSEAEAQWAAFVNDTAARMSSSPLEAGITTITDNQEKDFAWADLDNDGDTDLVCVRKVPFTVPGGKRGILFMNEGGVLIDRTATKANTTLGQAGSNGMLDQTNDRDVVIVDVNNDGWKDVVSATTISDGLPKYIGHPRIYMNMGESGGVWQGLRYEVNRFPQLLSKAPNNIAWNPRFCSVAAGDLTGDGYADLYFGDYDAGSFDGGENPAHDMDNKLLINMGASNPGTFVDESVLRMGKNYTYNIGTANYLFTTFGAASVIADMNGDGVKDVVKQTSLQNPIHVAVLTNSNPPSVPPLPDFQFNRYKEVYNGAAYFVTEGDLNNDGRLDLVMTDDGADQYLLNTGNDGAGQPNFLPQTFSFQSGGDDGFGGQSAIVDLDNDGFRDVLISDIDVDDDICCRRLHIYRNLGNIPTVTLREESPSIIPTTMLASTHNVAPIDINGDGWTDLVIGRLNSTEVWMNTGVRISATPPTFVSPSVGTPVAVQITKGPVTNLVAGGAQMFVSVNGGAYSPTTLTPLGGDQYSATLPAGPCGDRLRFYLRVQATLGGATGTFQLPANAPTGFFNATRGTGTAITLDEAFEGSVATWTVTNDAGLTAGAWQAADPVGTINSGSQAAPEDDATIAPGVNAFITQNGIPGDLANNSDIDGSSTHLRSPTIDATAGTNFISYAYWFYTSDTAATTGVDTLIVSVSNNNGATWTTAKTYSTSSAGWVRDSFRIDDFVPQTSEVRVRFSAADGGTATVAEAGVDDFRLERVLCAPPCPADINGSTTVDVNDLLAVITTWGACPGCPPAHCPGDIAPAPAGDCQIDVNDLLQVITTWGPCPN